MKSTIKEYHLHKDDHSKLHFEIKDATKHCTKYHDRVYKAHRHTYYQLIWFEEAGTHYVDYNLIEHPANSLFFLNKNQVHYFCHNSMNSGTLFHFDEIFLHQGNIELLHRIQYKFFNEMDNPYLVLDTESIATIKSISDFLKKEIQEKKQNYKQLVFNLFQVIILTIERLKDKNINSKSYFNADFSLAVQFKQTVDERIGDFLTIDQHAAILGITKKKLTKVTKEYLSKSPSKIIHQRKILEAQRLLSNMSISIKEVAYALGFDQATYFTKYFKKHTGQTPKNFVKLLP